MLPGLDDLEAKTQAATRAADPTACLQADHDWLRAALEVYRPLARSDESLDEVQAAVLALKPRLELHILREEEAYFPALEEFMREAGQGSMFDMYGEHDMINIRLEQLLRALDTRSAVGGAYSEFARALSIHFENEEDLIFEEAPSHLTEEASRTVLDQFEALAARSSER